MDDFNAICRLKQGDISGLEFLISRYQHKAVQTAYLITHDEQMAEDAAQDAFVSIYQNIGRFDSSRPFEPYLLRSVVNFALNACEKTSRWIQFGAGTDVDEINGWLANSATTEETVERSQLKQQVADALKRLSPRQRSVIVQRYYLGMSEKEMALSLSVAAGTIKWHLSSARERLRNALGMERKPE